MLQPPAKSMMPMRFENVQCKEQSKSRGPFQPPTSRALWKQCRMPLKKQNYAKNAADDAIAGADTKSRRHAYRANRLMMKSH